MMASSNAATKAFFKSGYGIVLASYDTRRGQQEGRESEKILAFYPPTAPGVMQSSIVGLAQALTMFAGERFQGADNVSPGPSLLAACAHVPPTAGLRQHMY
jgi:hypothetical protein